ncbi:hypothetical protein FNW52_16325 [Flavobacterium sp. ZT3R18]|uniref:hypothetical protein n=1 Tax=Flavobacterium sp. ZT3R18 TaxID=2594429 RepID=UPI001179A8A5|nr:hypothetical protein [Flavobacterium sp. ZT3R18]TRX32723.1 hypothetical protein FNW52_16325 [Flavobacterium sp. ZT3R18]
MSRIRIVGGDILETTGGNHKVYSKENIENSSDTQMIQVGKTGGVIYGDPQKAPDIKSKFFQDKIPEYVVLFKRLPSYKGEFGWDYMRDDYLTGTCIEGLEDLKRVYKPIEIQTKNATTSTSYGIYYTPWLSMFVNHNAVIGKEVELSIDAPVDFISDSVDFSKEEMTFVPSTPNLRVVPDKMPIADAINGGRIKIFCDATLDADATIDIKSSKGDVVGKMNVLKNKDVDKLTINVYVIKSFIKDDPLFSKSVVDSQINSKGGLGKLEEYLNKQSLNQALIQIKIIHLEDWIFTKQTLLNTSTTPNTNYTGMVRNSTSMLMDTAKYMNFINDRFKKGYPSIAEHRGLFIYLTPFSSLTAGGASYSTPLTSKHIILFKANLDHFPSYAHEIGHTLGLEHTFLAENLTHNEEIADVQNKFDEENRKQNQAKISKTNNLRDNAAYYATHSAQKEEATKILDNNINIYDENIKHYKEQLNVLKKNPYKFLDRRTENIMDYDLLNQMSFYKWQWSVMEQEAKTIYH